MKIRKTILTFSASLFAALPAHAVIIAQDNFDGYTDSQLHTQGSAGDGWAGAWTAATNPGNSDHIIVASGVVTSDATASSNTRIERVLSTPQGADGQTVFIGIDYDFGTFYSGFELSNTPGGWDVSLNRQSAGTGLSTKEDGTIRVSASDDGSTLHRFVIQIDFGAADADTATLWRDGVNLGSTSGTDFSFDRVALAAFTPGGRLGGADNLIVATTFAEAAAIPEPSSSALLGLSGLALLIRRRK